VITAAALLREATGRLAAAGIEQPAREARLLICHALGLGPGALPDPQAMVDPVPFEALLKRRLAREPMALITGRQGFWTLDLAVSPVTLIPRPDSETLIEAALAALPDRASVRHVLDLGTGTGALLLAALSEFPAAWGVGVDINPEAAALAADNARSCGLAGRTSLLCADWAAALNGRFDLALCNPPYIAIGALPNLMPEVARYEPALALDGGTDGLNAYRRLIPALPDLLTSGGVAVLEIGQGQGEATEALALAAGFPSPHLRCDLAGIPRALVLRRENFRGVP
jgi:release factor glutamine methyltransferase